jgi:hypothetical protein
MKIYPMLASSEAFTAVKIQSEAHKHFFDYHKRRRNATKATKGKIYTRMLNEIQKQTEVENNSLIGNMT